MTDTRAQRLNRLRHKERTQVLVVGGGINGISTFRELALNGVDVVLVDRYDFMSGASSAPSRMIHGGLRYLENGEFALVRESLRERNLLLRNAPHLVTPLPTLVPLTDRFSGVWSAIWRFLGRNVTPGNRGALIVKLGLSLYDLYSGHSSGMPRHRFFGRVATASRWPELRPDIAAAAVYYDAKISHPERLGLELLLESEDDRHALALNHVALASLTEDGATLEDRLSGETFRLDADIVVNATGAWVDLTNAAMSDKPSRLIGGTKGSHIVISNERLLQAVGDYMVYFVNREGRVCILFAHLGNVLAGSTDIKVTSPDNVRCEQAEVDYILASVREVFPAVPIAEGEIIYRFAGVRPLPSSEKVNANISRDHSCEWLSADFAAPRPVLNLIGGKWTTFRAFGEQASDKILARLGQRRAWSTEERRIGGGRDFPSTVGRTSWADGHPGGLSPDYAEQLLSRYGTRAREFVDWMGGVLPVRLETLATFTRGEIEWLIERESVATLADLVLRRMTIAFTGELSLAAIKELGGIAASSLGWDEPRRRVELARLLDELEIRHGLSQPQLESRNPDVKDKDRYVRRKESAHEPAVRERQVS